MSAHTPGRWIATPDPNSNPHGHTRGDYCIGREGTPVDEIAVCSGIADANLIAAAPFMLSALQHIASQETDSANATVRRMAECARAAIAKATQP